MSVCVRVHAGITLVHITNRNASQKHCKCGGDLLPHYFSIYDQDAKFLGWHSNNHNKIDNPDEVIQFHAILFSRVAIF